jgi:hypothetical protein
MPHNQAYSRHLTVHLLGLLPARMAGSGHIKNGVK